MKSFIRSFFTTGAISLLLFAQAGAQEADRLEEIKVQARPIGLQSLEHISQPVTVLSDEALKKRQSSTVGETLENIPGVSTNRFSPLASRPVIRGLSGSRVQVLENGLGSLDVSTLSVDHVVSVDPLRAQQIEIFRGPGHPALWQRGLRRPRECGHKPHPRICARILQGGRLLQL